MDAILLSAGLGSRMKQRFPKQFIIISGKPMFIYALEVLRSSKYIEKIIVTCNADHYDVYLKYIKEYNIEDVECIVGGDTRQESVYEGLKKVATPKVLIHEAARPFISRGFVDSIIESYREDAVIPTVPVSFSIVEGETSIESELDRSRLRNVQLPQMFTTKQLIDAHEKAQKDGYTTTEDGMLLFHYGGKVHLVEGRESNIKVTTMLDLEIVEKLLRLK